MIHPINLRFADRAIDFSMDLDPSCVADMSVYHYLKQGVPCEPENVYVMLRALKEGDCAVDAGANVGFFTLLMSKLVGPSGQVLAFEPGADNLRRLSNNLNLNRCNNVRVIDQPLWSEVASVPYFSYEDSGANSLWAYDEGDCSEEMLATTLDRSCYHQPQLIKMDVEGAELQVLRGAKLILQKNPIILTEMNEVALQRAGSSFADIRAFLSDFCCFGLSEINDFPTYIPSAVTMRAKKMNTNVMFASPLQVNRLWPEAYV